MKISSIVKFETLKITFPFGKTLLSAIVLFPTILLGIEFLFRNTNLYADLPPPTLNSKFNFPEIDVKYQIFESRNKVEKFDCLLLGNSMVDYGIDPDEIKTYKLSNNSIRPNCFNFALEALMPETSSILAKALINKHGLSSIVLGISAIDFAEKSFGTRNLNQIPWFQYLTGQNSFEGWLIDHFIIYRYFLSTNKYRVPYYQNETNNLKLMIDQNGQQIREKENTVYQVNPVIKIPDFTLYQPDVSGLASFGELRKNNIKITVIEMPVNPKFLPYYVQKGEKGYEDLFIKPIESLLQKENIQFVRSQPEVAQVVTPDGWLDYSHLNDKGATQFSRWLALKIDTLQ